MLHDFVTSNHEELIKRCRDKAALRVGHAAIPATVDKGVPLFLGQLADTLRAEHYSAARNGDEPESAPSASPIGRAAALHGAELLRRGLTIDQVVHEYGDVCQSVTELAIEEGAAVSTGEFRTMNLCLDNAIADAVTAFGLASQIVINERAEDLHTRLNSFAIEHEQLADVAMKALAAIKTGTVGLSGATGSLLEHALAELRYVTQKALPEIRLASATTALASTFIHADRDSIRGVTASTVRPEHVKKGNA